MAVYHVHFVLGERDVTIDVRDDQYLLDAAAAAGLDLPHMCLQGWCTTCAAKMLDGTVDQSEALRIYPEDQTAGFVLLCSAFARSDLKIVTHQRDEMRNLRRSLGLPAPRG